MLVISPMLVVAGTTIILATWPLPPLLRLLTLTINSNNNIHPHSNSSNSSNSSTMVALFLHTTALPSPTVISNNLNNSNPRIFHNNSNSMQVTGLHRLHHNHPPATIRPWHGKTSILVLPLLVQGKTRQTVTSLASQTKKKTSKVF
ncbi:hypothetical protein BDB00DRAFT_174776 [Zychaea mexicana]|uniref:uncharacterized protein n=1 Tax=Zychaea mexicana TaxID=64656 RepID=UPI0022FE028D|nr:uncharacterized protein BDB00DRAFT_174776 [Zychaea mexicana]KAI9479567.1 hypothetical protein BDB00DRAFT_174776 [Zychaea mexicana]